MSWLEPTPPEPELFKAGDFVRLKSGGPVMVVEMYYTVEAAYATGCAIGAHCAWFDEHGHAHQRAFRGDALVAASEPSE